MKKRIALILSITMLMCSACTNNMSVNDKTNESDSLQEQNANPENKSDELTDNTTTTDVESGAVVNEPSWATGTQTEGKLYQNLNLDGIGEADDEAYVSVYQFGDYEDKVTVISIHLGTGETMAQIFPVYGDYSFLTGKVFSEEKDAIILEVQVPSSNYGAATVFALDVNPVGVDPIPTVTTRLDTENSITLADGNVLDNSFITNSVTRGTEVVDVSGMSRQGILIYFLDENGHYQGLQRIFYWTDNGWTVISE